MKPVVNLLALVALASGIPVSSWAAPATVATDVCPAMANPCNVMSAFEVTQGAVLDFGVRTVNVTGSGKFDFNRFSGSILCGNFTASTTNATIDANGVSPLGGTSSGAVTIEARRLCSAGSPATPCVSLSDCQLGSCDTRRCETNPSRTCTSDVNCDLGICGANKRCSGSVSFVRCDTNADCFFGACDPQLTCKNRAGDPVGCSNNADCDFGTCSVGTASISMGGSIVGNSDAPASIELRAADNVTITKPVNVSSTSSQSDGGEFVVEAAAGSITTSNSVSATGGVASQGGFVELFAGTDVNVGGEISVVGGDFDGGSIEIDANRDVTIGRSLLANAAGGSGYGGEIIIDAGRHLVVNGVSSSNKTTFETNGNTDVENFAGDGGIQELTTDGNLTMNVNTRSISLGSQPDGLGGETYLDATGNLVLHGDITARAQAAGEGGYVSVVSAGTATVSSTGTFDLTGGADGGGILEFESAGATTWAGLANASGGVVGFGGSVFLDVDNDVTFSGDMVINGSDGGALEVYACRLTMTGTGSLDINTPNGDNYLSVRENMKLLAGSSVTTGVGGKNQLVYRTAAKPPQTSGTISPAPQLIVDGTLGGCPVCGNGELDGGETCEDGNTANGDGCSSDCQNEKCIQQTGAPGYPTVPLCDDGNFCTTDTCNTSLNGGTCQHTSKNCADNFSCTTDSCNAQTQECEHVANDAGCNDGNPCTDDFCSVSTGCGGTANSDPCNDGDACTENDTCSDGECSGTPIQGCGFCGDGSVNGSEACDDGNATFTSGEYCGVDCVLIPCGKPTNSTGIAPKSSDALFALKAAVGQVTCSLRVCDVNLSMSIVASDAQRILRAAVGQEVTLTCPTTGS